MFSTSTLVYSVEQKPFFLEPHRAPEAATNFSSRTSEKEAAFLELPRKS